MALNENITEENRLEELGGSDYEIVDSEPNIKGWEVKNRLGEKIGEVDELLFNPQSLSVRYLVVDLDDNELGLDEDRKVLIPIGLAELHSDEVDNENETDENTVIDEDNEDEGSIDEDDTIYDPRNDDDVVILPHITAEQLRALPSYEKNNVTPETESIIRNIFEGLGAAGTAAGTPGFYQHEHFNENRFYNSRNVPEKKLPIIEENLNISKKEVETGGARITSRLIERPVEKNIDLKEEHVNVEHIPVNRPVANTDQAFKETELELTEHAEVPVVNKEARIVEEVSLNKNVEEKEETIHDTVRKTEIDTEKIPGSSTENRT